MLPILVCACAVESMSDSSFGDGTGGGTAPSTTMRVTAGEGSSDSGTDEGSQSSTTPSSAEDTTDTASDGCPVGRMCLSNTPDDWYGPVAVHMGDPDEAAVECPESYPGSGLSMLSGYTDPGPAVCDCTCSLDVTSSCYSYAYDMDASCSSYESFYQIMGDCAPMPLDGGVYFYMYLQGTPTCHSEVTENIPEPIWESKVTTCRDAEPGAECDGGTCMPVAPEGFETGLCIYREGSHNCPADGDFTVHYTNHSGVDDTRSCSYCGCGSGTASCTGSLDVYQSNDCTGAVQTSGALNVCTAGVSGGQSVAINFTGDGGCPVATPPEAQGEIATAGEFTYCCTQ